MEITVRKPLRLEQLTEELRAALPETRIDGVSVRSASDGERLVVVHAFGGLSDGEQATVRRVIEAHAPAAAWGLSPAQKALAALLDKPAGTLSTAEIETSLRLIVDALALTAGPLLSLAADPARSEEQ